MTTLSDAHKKRVLIIEANEVLRQGLLFLLRSLENVARVDEAYDIIEALYFCVRQSPDLIIMGVSSEQSLQALTLLQTRFRGIRVILMTDEDSIPTLCAPPVTCISRGLPMAEILSTLSNAAAPSAS
ncbi:MAG: response regulator [Anaerolineae bacterium]|nr:response regulator [Anaerolineae bacterium]